MVRSYTITQSIKNVVQKCCAEQIFNICSEFLKRKGKRKTKMFDINKLQEEFSAKARRLLKRKMVVEVKVCRTTNAGTSYTYMKDANHASIIIDFEVAESIIKSSTSESNMDADVNEIIVRLKMILEGFLYHEIGHLLYSQFEPLYIIKDEYDKAHKNTESFIKQNKDSIKKNDEATRKQLIDLLYKEIYYKTQKDSFLNSLEDSTIECIVPSAGEVQRQKKKILACISKARDGIYAIEAEYISWKYLASDQKTSKNLLVNVLNDIHEMGIIGYRKDIETPFFDYACDNFNINRKKVEDLVFYSKFMTKNTMERMSCSQLILDELSELIEMKAEHLYTIIQNALKEGRDDQVDSQLDSLLQQDNQPTEVALSMPNQTSSASCSSSSEYEYDLDDHTKKDLENKIQSAKNYQQDNCKQKGQEDQENETDADATDADAPNQENETDTSTKETKDGKKPLPSRSELDETAKNAEAETEAFEKEIEEKEAEESLKKMIQNRKNDKKEGKKPKNICTMDEYGQIKTRINEKKYAGIEPNNAFACDAYNAFKRGELNRPVCETANYINEIKMYAAKAKRRNGIRKGKLNTSSLYRVKTDRKCFQQTVAGKKKNFRISVLIDESGSMSNNDKMIEAVNAAYIIGKACQQANIPVAIWGHSMRYSLKAIDLDHFVDFKDRSPKSMEAVFNAYPGGNNLDGLALYHTLTDLAASKSSSDEKLIQIIISDGEPCEDLKDVKKVVEMFEKVYSIETIGIGLNLSHSEERGIRYIYKNNLMVKDPKDLPKSLTDLLKHLVNS